MPATIKGLRLRLALMTFLEFGVWGAYLISLGNFLTHVGLATKIGWFYAVQGIVSLFMPTLIGILADRLLGARKMLSLCHMICAIFMGSAGSYCLLTVRVEFWPLFLLYAIAVAFFIPTIALSNSIIFSALRKNKMDPATNFPYIRIFGTIGFIGSMLFVNFTQFQTNAYQLLTASTISLILSIYALTLKDVSESASDSSHIGSWIGALGLFKQKNTAIFLIFCILIGVALQITNSYGNPYISSFQRIAEFADTWGAKNANALISISQISEALCILFIPVCIRKFGIKNVILTAILAWSVRFALLGAGNPGGGVWMIILSGIVYGVAFDFFNIAGSMYIDRQATAGNRASAQGLFMAMSAGIGGSIGLIMAQAVVNHLVFRHNTPMAQYSGWETSWFIFAAYALVIALLFSILFKPGQKINSVR